MGAPISTSKTPAVVVPGNHDGVHLGHAALLAHARTRATTLGDASGAARVIALTFHPHPLRLIAPERAPELLTRIERRAELLTRSGADEVVVATFDEAYAQVSAEDFVRRELVERLHARAVVVGADFRFGHRRRGDVALLREVGAPLGLAVEVIAPVGEGELPRVSSTHVRDALRRGEVERASALLGRPHEFDGLVVDGQKRGRTIGFPTANLAEVEVMLPTDGVYAVLARVLDDHGRPSSPCVGGMMNLGTRPTFGAGRAIEVHLFDWEGDLYGRRLRVGLVARLRDERRFDGVDALVAQLHEDARHARARLGDRVGGDELG